MGDFEEFDFVLFFEFVFMGEIDFVKIVCLFLCFLWIYEGIEIDLGCVEFVVLIK